MREIARFFHYSPKRQCALDKVIEVSTTEAKPESRKMLVGHNGFTELIRV